MKKVVLYSSVFAAMMAAAPIAANAAAPEVAEVAEVMADDALTPAKFEELAGNILSTYGIDVTKSTVGEAFAGFEAAVSARFSNIVNWDDDIDPTYATTSDTYADRRDEFFKELVGQNNVTYYEWYRNQPVDRNFQNIAAMMAAYKKGADFSAISAAWETVYANFKALEDDLRVLNGEDPTSDGPAANVVDEAFDKNVVLGCHYAAYVDAYETDVVTGEQTYVEPAMIAVDEAMKAFENKKSEWEAIADPTAEQIEEYKEAAETLYQEWLDAVAALDEFAKERDAQDAAAYDAQNKRLAAILRDDAIELVYAYTKDEIYAMTTWRERQGLFRFLGNMGTEVDGKLTWVLTYEKIAQGIKNLYSADADHTKHNLSYYGNDVVLQIIEEYSAKVVEEHGNAYNEELSGLATTGYESLAQVKEVINAGVYPEVLDAELPADNTLTVADYEDYYVNKIYDLNKKISELPAGLDKESQAYKDTKAEVEGLREELKNLAQFIKDENDAVETKVAEADKTLETLPLPDTFENYTGNSQDAYNAIADVIYDIEKKYAEIADAKPSIDPAQGTSAGYVTKINEYSDLCDKYTALVELAAANDEKHNEIKAAINTARAAVQNYVADAEDRNGIVAAKAQQINSEIDNVENALELHYDSKGACSTYGYDFEGFNLAAEVAAGKTWADAVLNDLAVATEDIDDTFEKTVVPTDLDLDKIIGYVEDLNELFETVPAIPTTVVVDTTEEKGEINEAFVVTTAVTNAQQAVDDLFAEADEDLLLESDEVNGPAHAGVNTTHIENLKTQIEKAIEDLNKAITASENQSIADYYVKQVEKEAETITNELADATVDQKDVYGSEAYDTEVDEAAQAVRDGLMELVGIDDPVVIPGIVDEIKENGVVTDDDKATVEAKLDQIKSDLEDYQAIVADANANEDGYAEVLNGYDPVDENGDPVLDENGDPVHVKGINEAQTALEAAVTAAEDKIAEVKALKKGDGSLQDAVLDQAIDNAIADIKEKLEKVKAELEAVKAEAEDAYNAGDLKDEETVQAILDKLNGYNPVDENGDPVLDENEEPVHVDGITEKLEDIAEDFEYVKDRVDDIEKGEYVVGNVDGDALNMIDEFDFLALAEAVLEGKSVDELPAGDLDLDGELTIQDVKNLISWVGYKEFGRVQAPSRRPKFEGEIALESNGNNIALALNSNIECSAIQFDVTVPEGASIADFVLTNRANGLNVATNKIGTDKYRVLVLSFDGTGIEGTEGALVNFNVNGVGEVLVDNVITAGDRATRLNAAKVAVSGITTGIADATVNTTNEAIFGLNGVRFNTLQQGINIVNGKKIVK